MSALQRLAALQQAMRAAAAAEDFDQAAALKGQMSGLEAEVAAEEAAASGNAAKVAELEHEVEKQTNAKMEAIMVEDYGAAQVAKLALEAAQAELDRLRAADPVPATIKPSSSSVPTSPVTAPAPVIVAPPATSAAPRSVSEPNVNFDDLGLDLDMDDLLGSISPVVSRPFATAPAPVAINPTVSTASYTPPVAAAKAPEQPRIAARAQPAVIVPKQPVAPVAARPSLAKPPGAVAPLVRSASEPSATDRALTDEKRRRAMENASQVVCVIAYSPTDHTHLSMKVGDVIEVLRRRGDELWKGALDDTLGWFPTANVDPYDPSSAKPVATQPTPVIQPVAPAQPAAVAVAKQPVATQPTAVAVAKQPVETQPAVVVAPNQPVATQPAAVVVAKQPVETQPAVVVAPNQPVATQPAAVVVPKQPVTAVAARPVVAKQPGAVAKQHPVAKRAFGAKAGAGKFPIGKQGGAFPKRGGPKQGGSAGPAPKRKPFGGVDLFGGPMTQPSAPSVTESAPSVTESAPSVIQSAPSVTQSAPIQSEEPAIPATRVAAPMPASPGTVAARVAAVPSAATSPPAAVVAQPKRGPGPGRGASKQQFLQALAQATENGEALEVSSCALNARFAELRVLLDSAWDEAENARASQDEAGTSLQFW